MKKINSLFVNLVMMVVLSINFSSCTGGGGNSYTSANISSIEDLKGKTWQYTGSSANGWYKVKINSNNTYDAWFSAPAQGEWENHISGSYSVDTTKRDMTNGKILIVIYLENCSLAGLNYLIAYKGTAGVRFSSDPSIYKGGEGVVADQTDRNPWN